MPPITILDTPQITIRCYPETKIVHHQMHGYCHGKDFRDALMAGVDAMRRYGADKWLSDDRELPVLDSDDREWGEEFWAPEVLKAGWRYWAIVQPARALARVRMEERGGAFAKRGVTVKYFTEPDEALRWLQSQ
jgi:hypothetical protein